MTEQEFEEQLKELSERVLSKSIESTEPPKAKEILKISSNIDTSYNSHSKLCELCARLSDIEAKEVSLDFSKVDFIASNQFAILGCMLDTYRSQYPNTAIYFSYLKKNIRKTIRKNGFHTHLGIEGLPDIYNTTIPYNVSKYCNSINVKIPDKPLEWAIAPGNTTRQVNTPGGLGLSLLRDFIELNKGQLYIVSGNETYEQNGNDTRHMYMEYSFPGTIVTVAFNLSDDSTYHMESESFPEIIF